MKRRLALGSPGAKSFLEAIYATTGIDNFLLAGKEGMTLRTNINVDVFAECRTGLDDVAAATGSGHITILGVDIGFHGFAPWHIDAATWSFAGHRI